MEVGADVWIRDAEAAWVPGTITAVEENALKVQRDGDGAEVTFDLVVEEDGNGHPDVKLRNTDLSATAANGRGGVDDLIHLTHLHEPSILHVLELRYRNDSIYTYTGPILLAVNPFQRLPIYTKEALEEYYSIGLLKSQGVDTPKLPPHVYATADTAYRCMMNNDPSQGQDIDERNQTMLVSGESGAGKTETTKIIMQYLAIVGRPRSLLPNPQDIAMRMAPHLGDIDEEDEEGDESEGKLGSQEDSPTVEQRVLQSNPILEAFGNSKTLRNDNSSRFGKFIELQFNRRGELVGARIETYLLEKIRVVTQAEGERSFHVFYQLLGGLPPAWRETLGVGSPSEHEFLKHSNCYELADDPEPEAFHRTQRAMDIMGIEEAEQSAIWEVLAGILLLGDVRFVESKGTETEGSKLDPATDRAATLAARWLGVSKEDLEWALTGKQIQAGVEVYRTVFTPDQALAAVQALAKDIYGHLFNWLVSRVNTRIRAEEEEVSTFIGVLDIFGFEHFKTNSFEQLCINYANETLQQQFNQFVFKLEQEEYAREGIDWTNIDFPDNQDCLDLIEGKRPPGIIALLDEQCLLGGKATDSGLANKFQEQLREHPRFRVDSKMRARAQFVVRHYAGEVLYTTDGFLEKNRDQIHAEATEAVAKSESDLVQQIYEKERRALLSREGGGEAGEAAGGGGGAAGGGGGRGRGKKSRLMSQTVGSQFKAQLGALLKVIRSTTPHYVRCLKPNSACVPRKFERVSLVEQLRCGGVLEAVRVARLGFPVRLPHAEFLRTYQCLLSKEQRQSILGTRGVPSPRHVPRRPSVVERDPEAAAIVGRVRSQVQRLLASLDPPLEDGTVQPGTTKVFFRRVSYEELEKRRQNVMRDAAVKLQAQIRRHRCEQWWQKVRAATVKLQCIARSFLAQLLLVRLRRDRAALRLSAFARRTVQRSKFLRMRHAVVALQSARRGAHARELYQKLRANHFATKLQAWRRGRVKRSHFRKQREAAVRIQCAARVRQSKQKLAQLRKEAREVGNLRDRVKQLQQEVQDMTDDRDLWKRKFEELKRSLEEQQREEEEEGEAGGAEEFKEGEEEGGEGGGRGTEAEEQEEAVAAGGGGAEGVEEAEKEAGGAAESAPATRPPSRADSPAGFETPEARHKRALALESARRMERELRTVIAELRASLAEAERRAENEKKKREDLEETVRESAGAALAGFTQKRQQRMETQMNKLRREVEEATRRVAAAERSRMEAMRAKDDLQKAAEELATQNVDLKRDLERARSESVTGYQRQVDQLTQRMSQLERDNDTVREEKEHMEKEMREQVIQRESEIGTLQARVVEIQDELSALRESKKYDSSVKMALAQRLDVAHNERNEALQQVRRLEHEVARLREELGRHAGGAEVAAAELGSPSPLPAHRDHGRRLSVKRDGPPRSARRALHEPAPGATPPANESGGSSGWFGRFWGGTRDSNNKNDP